MSLVNLLVLDALLCCDGGSGSYLSGDFVAFPLLCGEFVTLHQN